MEKKNVYLVEVVGRVGVSAIKQTRQLRLTASSKEEAEALGVAEFYASWREQSQTVWEIVSSAACEVQYVDLGRYMVKHG